MPSGKAKAAPSVRQIKAPKADYDFSKLIYRSARRAGAKIPTGRKQPSQTKEALAAKVNRRIDELIAEGYKPEWLPNKLNTEITAELTHRELRALASAASKKKSSGVYLHNKEKEQGYLLPEFRRSYEEAMVEIINARRARRKKDIENAVVKERGIVQTDKEGQPLRRAEMGDVRSRTWDPIEIGDRTFRDETYFIRNLNELLMLERDSLYRDNIVIALRRQFGNRANDIIAALYNADPRDVLRAYYSEEYFSIENVYTADRGDKEYLDILRNALRDAGINVDVKASKETKEWSTGLVKRSDEKEKLTFERLNRDFVKI